MNDLFTFINEELKPRLYSYIPQLFPDYDFKQKGDKWVSSLHWDGSEGTGYKEDRSVITKKRPHGIWDNTEQQYKEVFALYKERNNLSTMEAVKSLCALVCIPDFPTTEEQRKNYAEAEQRRSALEASAERQREALFSEEGERVLNYLRGRGWTDEEIKSAELGYISQSEASQIGAQYGVGDYYTLSIPLRTSGRLYGFKFRTVTGHRKEWDKYVYLKGTKKRENFFNLTGVQEVEGTITVVEGELDALHADAKGVKGIVATSGGALTDELLSAAQRRGIKRITLLFDKDEKGEEFVLTSIKNAWNKRISVLVATLPEETLPSGKAVKDLDDYLQFHSKDELATLISNAERASSYLLQRYVNEASAQNGGAENLRAEVERDLTRKVIELANQVPDQTDRDILFKEYSSYNYGSITAEALRAVADEERAAQNALQKQQQASAVANEISRLVKDGYIDEALRLMGETAKELQKVGDREKYSSLLAITTEQELRNRLQSKQDELPTLYKLKNPSTSDTERLTLPSGAITFVVAPTSHGKSTMLQNLALQVAQTDGEGTTLYFTFEEDKENVILQLANKYINEELCKGKNNFRAIRHEFKTGEDRYIASDKKAVYHTKNSLLFNSLINSGKLRVLYEDYDSTQLVEAVKYICSQTKVKAVFVDYVQLLSKNGNRKQRTEELKEICQDLKNLCISEQIALVVAAQANRETTSPLEMHSQKIAEASDLERIANKIIFLWNSSFGAQKSKDSKKDLEQWEKANSIVLGESGKMYIKLTKNRGGVVGLDAVLEYNGNTGVIKPNCEPLTEKQAEIEFGGDFNEVPYDDDDDL